MSVNTVRSESNNRINEGFNNNSNVYSNNYLPQSLLLFLSNNLKLDVRNNETMKERLIESMIFAAIVILIIIYTAIPAIF
jgi:hypothetical protein